MEAKHRLQKTCIGGMEEGGSVQLPFLVSPEPLAHLSPIPPASPELFHLTEIATLFSLAFGSAAFPSPHGKAALAWWV